MNQQNLFAVANDDNNITSFTMREAHRMWPSETHRGRCIKQVGRFVDFRDYGAKPISHFLPRDIHEFADQLAADGRAAQRPSIATWRQSARCLIMLSMSS